MVTTTTGLATSFITFSRPGASGGGATVTDADGKIKWAGHNLLTNSESFDASAWSKGRVTVSANAVAAPNSTTTADGLTQQTGQTTGGYALQNVTSQAGAYTISFFAKANGKNFVAVFETLQSASEVYSWINVSTGAAGTAGSGHTILTPVSVGNGWYLCAIQLTAVARSGYIGISLADTNGSYTVVDSGGVYLWGAHLYRSDLGGMQQNPAMGAGMGSYYPTTPPNALGYTEDFSNAYWVKQSTTVLSNAAIAPNNLQTADLVYPSSTGNFRSIYNSGSVSGKTISVYAKAAGKSFLAFINQSGGAIGAWFNLVTGVKGTLEVGYESDMVDVGNGWYRCWMRKTSGNLPLAQLIVTDADNSSSVTANGTDGIYLWGAQLSDSASLDAYAPVYGAAVTSAAYYAPRLDFDGATLSPKGLLVEEARTNFLLNSSAFGSWSLGDVTVTADNTAAPDGTSTADRLVYGSTGAYVFQDYNTTTAGAYTFSLYMRADSPTTVKIGCRENAIGADAVVCSLTTQWQRFTITRTASGSVTSMRCLIVTDSNTPTIYAWGAQLEAGSFATSLIPTGSSATATRTADVASVSTQAFPYSSTTSSLVASFSKFSAAARGGIVTLGASTGSQGNALTLDGQNDGKMRAFSEVNGTNPFINLNLGTYTANTGNKIAMAYAENNANAAANGVAGTDDTTAALPVLVDLLSIGAIRGSSLAADVFLNGHIRQITYLPRRISNAELQSRTQ